MVDQTTNLTNPFEGNQNLDLGNFLYIATPLPLRTLFMFLNTESATSQTLNISYYAGAANGWVSSLQTQDESNGLSVSGYFTMQPDPTKPWALVDDTANVTELNSVRFFNWYWVRISLSGSVTVDLQWLGHKFCKSSDITRTLPDTANSRVYQAFGKASANWDDLIIEASYDIIRDLRNMFNIASSAQILDSKDLRKACAYLTASYIYQGLGPAYADAMIGAIERYNKLISSGQVAIDVNQDGDASQNESTPQQIDFVR